MTAKTSDIVVAGGGIAGGFIAYRLAQAGLKVTLFERHYMGWGASGRNGGGVRQNHRLAGELLLAKASLEIWDNLEDEFEADLEFGRRGNLWLLEDEHDLQTFDRFYRQQTAMGVATELLDPLGVREVAPLLEAPVLGGLYVPGDGQANPHRVMAFLHRALVRAGVNVCLGTPVRAIVTRSGSVRGVETDRGIVEAPIVVCATGAWSNSLCEPLGLTWPIQVIRDQIFLTEQLDHGIQPFIIAKALYLRQAVAGNIHIGATIVDEVPFDMGTTLPAMRGTLDGMLTLFPSLRNTSIIRSWAGVDAYCRDEVAILGFSGEPRGLFMATGFTGHGFCLGPIVGEVSRDLVLGKEPALDLSDVSPSRFYP